MDIADLVQTPSTEVTSPDLKKADSEELAALGATTTKTTVVEAAISVEKKSLPSSPGDDEAKNPSSSSDAPPPNNAARAMTAVAAVPTGAPVAVVETLNKNTTNTNNNNTLIEEANNEIANLLLTHQKITNAETSKLQQILRDNTNLKEKVSKLKILLTRSAKANKETKLELETQKRMVHMAQQEILRLNVRLETLAMRPTHMDLLADFETNFDKAVLSLNESSFNHTTSATANAAVSPSHTTSNITTSTSSDNHLDNMNTLQENQDNTIPSQSGGESTISFNNSNNNNYNTVGDAENVSSLLMNELNEQKARAERLEQSNIEFQQRALQLQEMNDELLKEKDSANLKMSNLQLELRMAKMETENAMRAMREKTASLVEMQMEIDLVTRSAMDANVRAAEGMEVVKNVKSDKARVEELEAKIVALQEWAIAAATAKEIILEQNRELQSTLDVLAFNAVQDQQGEGGEGGVLSLGGKRASDDTEAEVGPTSVERKLWSKSSSLVIGAGMVQSHFIELGDCLIQDNETVLLRWQFDITPNDMDIIFSILKGRCEDKKKIREADAVMRDRLVQGGGGGEVHGAFAIQNTCTLVWSNEHSWIRPRSIKYSVDAFAVM